MKRTLTLFAAYTIVSLAACKMFSAADVVTVAGDIVACAIQHQDMAFEQILIACEATGLSDAEKIVLRDIVGQSRQKAAEQAAAASMRCGK